MDQSAPAAPAPAPAPEPAAESSTKTETGYPVSLNVDFPEKQSRILALFSLPFMLIRLILLIPHIIIIYILSIVVFVVSWINFWVILFTGHSSAGLHKFMVGVTRWSTRLTAYMYGMTDKYPPFSLD